MTKFPTDPANGTYDVAAIASLLGCSSRHIRRLAQKGKMPQPIRTIGRILRWLRSDVDAWVADGCPSNCEVANAR